MSFTEEGMKRVIAGEFTSGILNGRLGVELISISQKRIKMRFFIAASNDTVILFEYEPTRMKVGQQVLLDGAEITSQIGVVPE